jgi:hypothetical protein
VYGAVQVLLCNTWQMLASLATESRLLKTKVTRADGETVGKGELSAALSGLRYCIGRLSSPGLPPA